MNTRISPSLLAADFSRLDRELAGVSSADAIHLDVMDGIFVPNLSFGPPVLQSIRKVTDLFFDVHLMIVRPLDYVRPSSNAAPTASPSIWKVPLNPARPSGSSISSAKKPASPSSPAPRRKQSSPTSPSLTWCLS